MASLSYGYPFESEHSFATHGVSMVMVVAQNVADCVHFVLRLLRNQIVPLSQNITVKIKEDRGANDFQSVAAAC